MLFCWVRLFTYLSTKVSFGINSGVLFFYLNGQCHQGAACCKQSNYPAHRPWCAITNSARSTEEMMPLPYCNASISADAEPATLGIESSAQAVDVAAMMSFMEKNTNTAPTITVIPPTPKSVATATSAASVRRPLNRPRREDRICLQAWGQSNDPA